MHIIGFALLWKCCLSLRLHEYEFQSNSKVILQNYLTGMLHNETRTNIDTSLRGYLSFYIFVFECGLRIDSFT